MAASVTATGNRTVTGGQAPGGVEPHTVLLTKTTPSECRNESGGSCVPQKIKREIEGAAPVESEAVRRELPPKTADAVLAEHFKPAGPRDSDELLSNVNIDDVLGQWAAAIPAFVPFPFAMIDTPERAADHPLSAAAAEGCEKAVGPGCFGRLIAKGARCFACVFNTDRIGGRGIHWFAIFVDCRAAPWTIEYFNSSGRPTHPNVLRWMARARRVLSAADGAPGVESVCVSQIQHQRSDTECGLYSLYYVRCRLDGVPFSRFERGAVPDSLMREFRKHVFRQED